MRHKPLRWWVLGAYCSVTSRNSTRRIFRVHLCTNQGLCAAQPLRISRGVLASLRPRPYRGDRLTVLGNLRATPHLTIIYVADRPGAA